MGTRTFNFLVLAFWLATTTWLVVEKVLPGFRRGDPPNFRVVERAKEEVEPAPCWNIVWNKDELGWAATRLFPKANGESELRTQIQLNHLSADQLGQTLLRRVLTVMMARHEAFDVRIMSRMELDPLNRVRGFQSRVFVGEIPFPVLNLDGVAKAEELQLRFQVNSSLVGPISAIPLKAEWTVPLNEKAPLDDGSSPRGFMPPLRLGQAWKERVYSPLRLSNNLLGLTEELEVKVEREETMLWGDGVANAKQAQPHPQLAKGEVAPVKSRQQLQKCWLVVYRQDAGAGTEAIDKPLGWMWVRQSDGMVLRQEVNVFGARLQFIRLTAAAATQRAKTLDWDPIDWSAADNGRGTSATRTKSAEPAVRKELP